MLSFLMLFAYNYNCYFVYQQLMNSGWSCRYKIHWMHITYPKKHKENWYLISLCLKKARTSWQDTCPCCLCFEQKQIVRNHTHWQCLHFHIIIQNTFLLLLLEIIQKLWEGVFEHQVVWLLGLLALSINGWDSMNTAS